MKSFSRRLFATAMLLVFSATAASAQSAKLADDGHAATISITKDGPLRAYELATDAPLRGNRPAEKKIEFSESPDQATVRSGDLMFDGLYAMAVNEALENSVSSIKDNAYDNGAPIPLEAYQTGEFWTYVWTRDLSYSVYLALAQFDPHRSVSSLLFKTSVVKPGVSGLQNQIIQDTGSGGSYPVSSDRIVWALGAEKTMEFLPGDEREKFLQQVYPILHDTVEQDRQLVFDATDGLYRGEQSFLDWREQSYPGWTKDNVLPIAESKALSVNAADYHLLKTTAEYAKRLGKAEEATKYSGWADELKKNINVRFFDAAAGLYSTYLLSDGVGEIQTHRYDLLGESLAVLTGVAGADRAETILKNYPVGPHGPSVVWPQERSVPIYHNQAIWPFVTAFWIKAACAAEYSPAIEAGIGSLEREAAFNLSNMENFDFVTGLAEVKGQKLDGPVINSRRQLWSVAGYLSMVQDAVFGLETSWDGIRFRPHITAKLRNETFGESDSLELRNFAFRNTRNSVRIHLPATKITGEGVCAIERVELNGRVVGDVFISTDSLQPQNQWDIYLRPPPATRAAAPLRLVDVSDERAIFGPRQPEWEHEGITVADGRLVLHYVQNDVSNVVFNIFRDGQLCAKGIRSTQWVDQDSVDYTNTLHRYAIEAVDARSGNASHISPIRFYRPGAQEQVLPAKDMQNRGGNLVDGHHFENWGKSGDELLTPAFMVAESGSYEIRAEFSNGMGPVNTGITCGVKKLEVLDAGSHAVVASGHLVMPQSGDWQRWDLSSPVVADLKAKNQYLIRISEDEYSRNMSYLKNNECYTAHPGGGGTGMNFVNIASLHLLLLQGHFSLFRSQ
jgi:hypothetical protein